VKLQRYGEAGRAYLACAAKSPQDPMLQFDLARLYDKQGLPKDAAAAYKRALKLKPDPKTTVAILNNLAWLLSLDKETLDEAVDRAQEALRMYSKNPDLGSPGGSLLDTLGWIYFKKGDLTKARETLQKALQASPVQPTITYHMGRVFEGLGQLKPAIHYYIKALHFNPNFPEANDTRPRIALLRSRITD